VGVSATTFAEFNQDLYYNNELPVDQFQLPEDLQSEQEYRPEPATITMFEMGR
jgi:hypothetical protein